jgi:hypothetical protein
VAGLRAGEGQLRVDELVDLGLARLEQVGVRLLADLALERLPVHAHQILTLLPLQLSGEPIPQTLEMHETYAAFTFARHYAGVLLSRLIAPAEPASQLIFRVSLSPFGVSDSLLILKSDAGFGFLELLLIQLLRRLPHILTLEILHPELHTAQLNHIELLDLVVLYTIINSENDLTYFP